MKISWKRCAVIGSAIFIASIGAAEACVLVNQWYGLVFSSSAWVATGSFTGWG